MLNFDRFPMTAGTAICYIPYETFHLCASQFRTGTSRKIDYLVLVMDRDVFLTNNA
jgi:hypothetical protein